MATAVFTTVEARVNQVLSNAIWKDELQDNINGMAGAHNQLLVNGGFEPPCWQRGVGPFTAALAYTADRWQIGSAGSGITVTQETTIVDDGSAASLKAVVVGGSPTIRQKIEDFKQLGGNTIAISMRVRQSVASAVQLDIFVNGSGTGSPATSTTTGSFVTLSNIRLINPATTTSVEVYVTFAAAVTAYLDNAMLVIGPAPAPYRPLHPQEDLARCQRYYEVLGGVTDTLFTGGYGAAGATVGVPLHFKVTKGGVPTVTKNGTWAVTNCGQPTVGGPSPGSCNLVTVVTALGAYSFTPNSTDDTVTSEYNP